MESSVVEIRNMSFSYNGHPVLERVNFDVRQGDFIAVIGPNGGGKTTLLKLILGLLSPDQGYIRVLGLPASKASHFIGYVPQEINGNRSFPITALDVVLMGMLKPAVRLKGRSGRDRSEALDALEKMDMAPYAEARIDELSGGQRQRVLIARAMVTKPRLLLLDEPTSSIDAKGQTDFYRLLKKLNEDVTILVVSHDLMVISTYIKSIACVNRHLHYHGTAEITEDMFEMMYPDTLTGACPVELLAHGLPHRVLKEHR
ncbi:MAG TPA: ABC transporter ATP-binding protein [Syntrophales bacterium]|nr:ABC transporter ATP-binding protein [Syntrophales bacterium]